MLDTFIKFENRLEETVPPLPKLSEESRIQELDESLLETTKISPKSSNGSINDHVSVSAAITMVTSGDAIQANYTANLSSSDLLQSAALREDTNLPVSHKPSTNYEIPRPTESLLKTETSNLNTSVIEPLTVNDNLERLSLVKNENNEEKLERPEITKKDELCKLLNKNKFGLFFRTDSKILS